MKTLRQIFFALLLAMQFCVAGFGQIGGGWVSQHQFAGSQPVGLLGQSVDGCGDVNGDGFDDLIVGALGEAGYAGAAYVFSGADGTVLHHFPGPLPAEFFGHSVAGAGDVDGDGRDDLIVGAISALPGGAAYVFSGASGQLLHRFSNSTFQALFGYSVSGAGDVDADGFGDVVIGARYYTVPGLTHAGAAFVYSGRTGAILHQLNGQIASQYFGHSVADAGDVDRDGYSDVMVGSEGRYALGVVEVFSGATGAVLHHFDDGGFGGDYGSAVSTAGDVNADGVPDFLIGAYRMELSPWHRPGSVFVYSGASGGLLYRFDGERDADYFGYSVGGGADLNGDGFDDLIVGASHTDTTRFDTGSVYAFSGATGGLLKRRDGADAGGLLGWSVAAAGDVDASGLRDLIAGAPYSQVGSKAAAGQVIVSGFLPYLASSQASFSAATGADVDFILDFESEDAGERYRLLGSHRGKGPTRLGGLDIPLTAAGGLWLTMLAPNPPWFSTPITGLLDQAGDATIHLSLPAGATAPLVGSTLYFAAVLYVPRWSYGTKSSIAVSLYVLP